uniref:F-box domain-containing protein n=1 Tax=Aegilops tauschii TaxID=37682 RepID=M8CC68_AEGTA
MEETGQMHHPDDEVAGCPLRRSAPQPFRVRFRRGPGGGPDHLIALPEYMLLLVLSRLRCSRSAARIGVLLRRWHGLWTHLPDLTFRDVAPTQIKAALLGLVALRSVSNALDIEISLSHCCGGAGLSSLLHAAVRFWPQQLCFSYQYDRYIEVDRPCFERARVINMSSYNDICFTRLPAVVFPVVEILSLDGCSVIEVGTLVSLCLRLHLLRVTAFGYDIVVHSGSLQTLVISSDMITNVQRT